MFLHPVAGHLVANFETSDKTSCLAPHDADPFHAVNSAPVVFLFKSSDDLLKQASLLYLVFAYCYSLPFLQRKAEHSYRCML